MKKINSLDRFGIYRYISVFILYSLFFTPAFAQDEDDLNRSVTVERDFQPVIEDAGKIATKPAIVETTIDPAPIEYSEYTADVAPGNTFHSLLSQPTRFEPAQEYHGYIRGAVGHPNSLFDFGYHLDDGKKSILDIYAHHKAQWGLATLSRSTLGMNFQHPFSTCTVFFGVNGGNIYYHKYGHFYDYAHFSTTDPHRDFGMWEKNRVAYANRQDFTDEHRTSLWTAEAFVGVKSNPKEDVQYLVQTGYMLFAKVGAVAEHQIRTRAMVDWTSSEHHVGANFYLQNNFMQLNSLADVIPDSLYNSRHNFRLEPYYEYRGKRVRVHVGVNLDMNIGRGQNMCSATENITFAPSPHINMEAQIAKQWLTIYADVLGSHGFGSLQNFMENNRYRIIHAGIISHHPCSYKPVDAELGFHIRPYRDLLFEIHGGYSYEFDKLTLIANTVNTTTYNAVPGSVALMAGDFAYTYSNYGCGKVGGQINYHLQDKLRINLHGDYFFWQNFEHEQTRYTFVGEDAAVTNLAQSNKVYDRPNWKVGLRIDGRINKHWSVYSDNYFVGDRLALATDGEHVLRPTIDLNAGVEYCMLVGKKNNNRQSPITNELTLRPEPEPNLSFFFQLNNWLHRKNEIYYGYRSQGINFLAGITFRF